MGKVANLIDAFNRSFLRETLTLITAVKPENRLRDVTQSLEHFKESDWLLMGSIDYLCFLKWDGHPKEVICQDKKIQFINNTVPLFLTVMKAIQITDKSQIVIEYSDWDQFVLLEPLIKSFRHDSFSNQKHDPSEIMCAWSFLMKDFNTLTILPKEMRKKQLESMSKEVKLDIEVMLSVERMLRFLFIEERKII